MEETFVNLKTGIICHQPSTDYIYPCFITGQDLWINQSLLKRYNLIRILYMLPYHKPCKKWHKFGNCTTVQDPCKNCGAFKDHHHSYTGEMLPKMQRMPKMVMKNFGLRIKGTNYYLYTLSGNYLAQDCYIITPALSHFTYGDGENISYYGLSPGLYLVYNSGKGCLLSQDVPYEYNTDKPYYGVSCQTKKEEPFKYEYLKEFATQVKVPFGYYDDMFILRPNNTEFPLGFITVYNYSFTKKYTIGMAECKGKVSDIVMPRMPKIKFYAGEEKPVDDTEYMKELMDEIIDLERENVENDCSKADLSELEKVRDEICFGKIQLERYEEDGSRCGCCDGAEHQKYYVRTFDGILYEIVRVQSETRFPEAFTSGEGGYVNVYEPGTEQMDESDTTGRADKDTTHVDNSVPLVVNEVSASPLIDGGDSMQDDQAIDMHQDEPGPSCSCSTMQVDTPSGPQEAVMLVAGNLLPGTKPDFVPHVNLPNYINRWAKVGAIGINNRVYKPVFNDRVENFRKFFNYSHSHIVWKIVCKPTLFQSQRYWVCFNPSVNQTPLPITEFNNLIGFDWNPSENNELYVVTPWSSLEYMTVHNLEDFGRLEIVNRTDLVTEDGLPAQLDISVYCAPYQMTLYMPRITSAESESYYYMEQTYSDLGTINIDGSAHVIPIAAGLNIGDSISTGADGRYILSCLDNGDDSTVISVPGIYTDKVLLALTNGSSVTVLYLNSSPFSIDGVDATRVDGYFYLDFASASDSVSLVNAKYASFISNNSVPDIQSDSVLVSSGVNGLIYNNIVDTATTDTISSNVPLVLVKQVTAREEMYDFGHSYNGNSSLPSATLGNIGDHTTRIDNQWGFVISKTLESTDSQLVFNFSAPNSSLVYYDRDRHLMYYRYPKLKFVTASNPSSNVLIRITQIPSSTPVPLEKALQLPGDEWDFKTLNKVVQPYWDKPTIAITPQTSTCFIQLDVLSGTVGTMPIITMYYNCQDMEYFHFPGFSPQVEIPVPAVEQVGPITKESSVAPLHSTAGASQTERRWNYLTTLEITPSHGAVQIPVNARMLGPWPARHFGRYGKMRGNLGIKVMVTANRLVNGNIHVIHSNTDISSISLDSAKFLSLLGEIGHSVDGAPGSSLEFDLDWRKISPFMAIDFSKNDPDNGYLAIVIPATSSFSANDKLIMTLYVDVSGVVVDLARDTDTDGGYIPISPTFVSRPT
ncbi:hypothetical protein 2 [Beihai sea slater virus 2]|uniref:hypothetical protein 2 n=1 Tax=Beihai sea slater virus 2 TaxID=1922658 RepID=UPI00090CCDE1|nr:hypothetical protein 2 [Beihai sea slater virus 2]APG76776.1 hypothetical protein 2 [Beihai sea slater virus 2]